jgi:photosystem II stability/assembly factor-like uncharacterized protein
MKASWLLIGILVWFATSADAQVTQQWAARYNGPGNYTDEALRADSGWFWQNPLPQGNTLGRIDVVDANTMYAVGEAGTILRSTDGGVTWTIQASGTRKYLYAISCPDVNTCSVVGESGTILHTTNGGATWTAQSSGVQLFLSSVSFTDTNTGMVTGAGADVDPNAVILRTTDGGATWNTVFSRRTNQGYSVTCVNAQVCTASGARDGILRTLDAGANWTQQFSNPDIIVGGISVTPRSGPSTRAATVPSLGDAYEAAATDVRPSGKVTAPGRVIAA